MQTFITPESSSINIIQPQVIFLHSDGWTFRKSLKKIERIARICYKSEGNITENSFESFMRMLVDRGHEAMIEHEMVTFICTNDRGVSHEEVRHRIASLAQESTRYCNYSKDKFGSAISVVDIAGGLANQQSKITDPSAKLSQEAIDTFLFMWVNACERSNEDYQKAISMGIAPEIARSLLLNSLKTEIALSFNYRSLRNFFKLRTAVTAHPQMREIAVPMLRFMKANCPVLFDDIPLPQVPSEAEISIEVVYD